VVLRGACGYGVGGEHGNIIAKLFGWLVKAQSLRSQISLTWLLPNPW